jgi:hypothetical protein
MHTGTRVVVGQGIPDQKCKQRTAARHTAEEGGDYGQPNLQGLCKQRGKKTDAGFLRGLERAVKRTPKQLRIGQAATSHS